ncbi:trehalase-like domain-containing protein [Streptomyces sp. NPDC015032]|uniref:trehalase-like domain-containing protein n=1 Tax=Streptomyces sp. NPDC015032 TaxID=3364937 RepID=UPI0036F79E61
MNSRPARIEDSALIGATQTAALVSRDGSANWPCLPHFDSAVVSTSMLGTEDHGCWRIARATPPGVPAPHADQRRYHGDGYSQIPETLSLLGLGEGAVPVAELTCAAAPVMAA